MIDYSQAGRAPHGGYQVAVLGNFDAAAETHGSAVNDAAVGTVGLGYAMKCTGLRTLLWRDIIGESTGLSSLVGQ